MWKYVIFVYCYFQRECEEDQNINILSVIYLIAFLQRTTTKQTENNKKKTKREKEFF